MHVDITEYQIQKINVNQLKDNFKEKKTSVWYKNIIYEILLRYLKEESSLYVDGADLTNNQQNKKEDTSMKFLPKTLYGGPLVPNSESLDKKTNPYFNNPRAPYAT